MIVVSVDPGIRGCGVGVFASKGLIAAGYVASPATSGNKVAECREMARAVVDFMTFHASEPDVLVFEWPQVYGDVRGKDPNDLLALCGVDAAIAMFFSAKTFTYLPAQWKGQMKKAPCHERIRGRLSAGELQVALKGAAVAGKLAHNMWDGIGIGMHHLGRLKPERVITP